jgi:hypothetical protein
VKLKTVEDVLEAYTTGDDSTRASLRGLFARRGLFDWASGAPPSRVTTEGFRQHLLLISLGSLKSILLRMSGSQR